MEEHLDVSIHYIQEVRVSSSMDKQKSEAGSGLFLLLFCTIKMSLETQETKVLFKGRYRLIKAFLMPFSHISYVEISSVLCCHFT